MEIQINHFQRYRFQNVLVPTNLPAQVATVVIQGKGKTSNRHAETHRDGNCVKIGFKFPAIFLGPIILQNEQVPYAESYRIKWRCDVSKLVEKSLCCARLCGSRCQENRVGLIGGSRPSTQYIHERSDAVESGQTQHDPMENRVPFQCVAVGNGIVATFYNIVNDKE